MRFAGTADDLYLISCVDRSHLRKKISFQS